MGLKAHTFLFYGDSMGVYVFDFDCLRGASEDSKVIIKHNDKEMIISSLSTNKDGDVIIKVFEDWNEALMR